MTEEKRNNLDNAIQNGGQPIKHEVNHKKKDSKKIKHPHPSSSGARSMHTSQKEHSKCSEWTSVVSKKINVVDFGTCICIAYLFLLMRVVKSD